MSVILYCSDAAAAEIHRRIDPYGTRGIHFLDSGNYHYVTKIMTDRIDEPFSLILFDHHTDMQSPMIEDDQLRRLGKKCIAGQSAAAAIDSDRTEESGYSGNL